jgi:glucokinase
MRDILVGIDIGGTECSVSVAARPDEPLVTQEVATPHGGSPADFYASLVDIGVQLIHEASGDGFRVRGVGVVCGGPVSEEEGLVLGPPNLPGWDRVDVFTPVTDRIARDVRLVNDANASAIAEWQVGAAVGLENIVFLTFGTGMGAGIVLNGRLFRGTRGEAGEVGRMRMSREVPLLGRTDGTFEEFCSGGGIARMAARLVECAGVDPALLYSPIADRSTRGVFAAARAGRAHAVDLVRFVGGTLADGLRTIVEFLDPEMIVLGSVYSRSRDLLEPLLRVEFGVPAGVVRLGAARIVPAGLGEQLGSVASLLVAADAAPVGHHNE